MEYCSQHLLLCMLLVCQLADGVPTQLQKRARAARSASTCKNPPNLDILLLQANGITDGLAYVRSVVWSGTGMFPSLETTSSTSVQCNVGSDDTATTTDQQTMLQGRVLCPWSYEVRVLPDDYYPKTVLQAKCRCRRCVGGNDRNSCERVTTRIRVLKNNNSCVDGFYNYTETTIEVTVGCACVAPLTTPPDSVACSPSITDDDDIDYVK